jgi:small subunit ribosomal protein S3
MGQKISINLFRAKQRLSNVNAVNGDITNVQRSVWFASGRSYAKLLHQDLEIRKFVREELKSAGLVDVLIRRYFRKVEIILYVTKPGIVIGKGGESINKLKETLLKKFGLPKDFKLNIEEFKDPMRSAEIIAQEISAAIIKGVPYRKLCKTFIEKIRYSGILGAKITVKGRLNKAEIARKEDFAFGSIPRHTLDSVIDVSNVPCLTTAGILGVKVMLYKGDKIKNFTY